MVSTVGLISNNHILKMKLQLDVLAATAIKRKKPWPRFCWIGEDQSSLLMMDSHRVSILYLPSGKTKKKVSKLSSLLDDTMALSYSRNGHYLVGLLQFGNLFLWHKDRDLLKTISGLPELRVPKVTGQNRKDGKPSVHVSDDGDQILVITPQYQMYRWSRDGGQNVLKSKKSDISGTWVTIGVTSDVHLPHTDYKEAITLVAFQHTKVNGPQCFVTFVFNTNYMMTITTMKLTPAVGAQLQLQNGPGHVVSWTSYQYNLANLLQYGRPIRSRGAYVADYSHHSPIIALGVNQTRPIDTRLLYFSPVNETMLMVDMKGCGVIDVERQGRSYWLADVCWSHDDLFVVCITKHGSVCVTTRLGEPLIIQTRGHHVDLGPALYLPVHPLIRVQGKNGPGPVHMDPTMDSALSEMDLMRQRFSVTAHPTQHVFLLSDGYGVTVVTMENQHPLTIMRQLLISANRALCDLSRNQNIDLTLMDTLKFDDFPTDSLNSSLRSANKRLKFGDRLFEEQMESTADSDAMQTAPLRDMFRVPDNMNAGKIIFGDFDLGSPPATQDSNKCPPARSDGERALDIQNLLFSAWGVAVSNADALTVEMETLTTFVANLFVKLFKISLHQTGYSLAGTSTSFDRQSLSFPDALAQVVDAFKSIVIMCKFDTDYQNVMPIIVCLTRGTLGILLQARKSNMASVRLDAINACYSILVFLEHQYSDIYALIPEGLDDVISAQVFPLPRRDLYKPGLQDVVDDLVKSEKFQKTFNTLNKRFGKAWRSLYRHVNTYYVTLCIAEPLSVTHRAVTKILCRTQHKLQQLRLPLIGVAVGRVERGDGLYLEGGREFAANLWKEKIENMSVTELKSHRACRLLHSVLYTVIEVGDLTAAVRLADTLLINITETNYHDIRREEDIGYLSAYFQATTQNGTKIMLPCTEYSSARAVIQTLGRFMAAYFSNHALYIYPAHTAQALPELHLDKPIEARVIPVYHETVAVIIRQNKLEDLWNMERALDYLLVTGLLTEAIWFANKMGDWKAAFVMSSAVQQHISQSNSCQFLELPEPLTAGVIMRRRLELILVPQQTVQSEMLSKLPELPELPEPKRPKYKRSLSAGATPSDDGTNHDQLERTLRDLLTAATFSQQDIVTRLLSNLVTELRHVVCQLGAIVPDGFYLPAPPLYCPQPGVEPEVQDTWPECVRMEHDTRMKAAILVQTICRTLNAANCSLPCARWYSQQLKHLHATAANFRNLATSSEADLNEVLRSFSEESSLDPGDVTIRELQTVFRDFVTLAWLLHVRDKMALSLRKRAAIMKNLDSMEDESDGEQWLFNCFTCLQWTVALVPFTHYIDPEGSTYQVLLSQLVEFPSNIDSADILVQYFRDTENLPPEVQEKFQRLMKNWQGIFLGERLESKADSSSHSSSERLNRLAKKPAANLRGRTLSSYFHKQRAVITERMKERSRTFGSFEEFVFSDNATSPNHAPHIGSRAFEIEGAYLDFLDTFFTVCFSKQLELELQGPTRYPLLSSFSNKIREQELSAFKYKVVSNLHQKFGHLSPKLSPDYSPKSQDSSSRVSSTPPVSPRKNARESPRPPSSPRPRFMRRSMSVQELEPPGGPPAGILKKKSSSQTNIDQLELEHKKKIHRSVSFCQDSMYFGNYPMHRANSLSVVHSTTHAQDKVEPPLKKEHRSFSLTDLREKLDTNTKGPSTPNVSFTIFLAYHSGVKDVYPELARSMDWLQRWSNKHHSIQNQGLPAIRVKFHPYLVLFSLWLLQHKYTPPKRKAPPTRPLRSARPRPQPVNDELAHHNKEDLYLDLGETPDNHQRKSGFDRERLCRSWDSTGNKAERLDEILRKYDIPERVPEQVIVAPVYNQRPDVELAEPDVGVVTDYKPPPAVQRCRTREFVKRLNFGLATDQGADDSVAAWTPGKRRGQMKQSSESLLCSSTLNISSLDITSNLGTNVSNNANDADDGPSLHIDKLYAEQLAPVSAQTDAVNAGNPSIVHDGSPGFVGAGNTPGVIGSMIARQTTEATSTVQTETVLSGSNMADIGQQLQGVIRSELKRFVEVQHRGVLAMLGAVDTTAHTATTTTQHKMAAVTSDTHPIAAATQTTLSLSRDGTDTQTTTGSVNSDANNSSSKARKTRHNTTNDRAGQADDRSRRSQPKNAANNAPFRFYSDDLQFPYVPHHHDNAPVPPAPGPAYNENRAPVHFPWLPSQQTAPPPPPPPDDKYHRYGIPLLHITQAPQWAPVIPQWGPPSTPSIAWPPVNSHPPMPNPQAILQRHLEEFAEAQRRARYQMGVPIPLLHMEREKPQVPRPTRQGHQADTKSHSRKGRRKKDLGKQDQKDLAQKATQMSPVHRQNIETQVSDQVSDDTAVTNGHSGVSDDGSVVTDGRSGAGPSGGAPGAGQHLHDGYALSRGLFDDYLNEAACTDGHDTVARLQYDLFAKDKRNSEKQRRMPELSRDAKKIIVDYIEAQTDSATILPPDVLFSLKYYDGPDKKSDRRQFINVVDIDSGAFDDIMAVLPDDPRDHPVDQSQLMRQKLKRTPRVSVATETAAAEEGGSLVGPDRTTVEMFKHREVHTLSKDILSGRATRDKHKKSMLHKLEMMGCQLDAVEEMSKHVNTEYDDTKLMLGRLERMTETIHKDEKHHRLMDEHLERSRDVTSNQSARSASSSPVRMSGSGKLLSPHHSVSPPRPARGQSVPNRSRQTAPYNSGAMRDEPELSRVSGLSGVSDIIGEVIARGDIDLRHTGLTDKQAQSLQRKSRLPDTLSGATFSREPASGTDKPQSRLTLHEWMKEKQKRQSVEFKQRQQLLKESEHRPYQPQLDKNSPRTSGGSKELKLLQEKHMANRQALINDHIHKRKLDAQKLMADIIHDKPELPPQPETEPKITSARTSSRTVAKQKRTDHVTGQTTLRSRPLSSGAAIGDRRAGVEYDGDWMRYSTESYKFRKDTSPDGSGRRGLVRESSLADHPSDYGNQTYVKKMADDLDKENRAEERDQTHHRPYMPRPYQDVVRLQRPEVTRQKETRKPVPYVKRLAEINRAATSSAPSTRRSWNLNGTRRVHKRQPTSSRHVMTYTERLHEMKGQASAGAAVSIDLSRTHTVRSVMSARKPAHPAISYGDRLRAINAAAPKLVARSDVRAVTPRTPTSPPFRRGQRQRPYRDPYQGLDAKSDDDTQLSPWQVDETMRNILYGNEDDNMALGEEALPYSSDELTVMLEDEAVTSQNYADLVDVQDIVDAVSLSDGSIMSVIDWDAVEQLIADVK